MPNDWKFETPSAHAAYFPYSRINNPTQDVLECSTNLLVWMPVPNATSPYNVQPNNGMKFYRVRKI